MRDHVAGNPPPGASPSRASKLVQRLIQQLEALAGTRQELVLRLEALDAVVESHIAPTEPSRDERESIIALLATVTAEQEEILGQLDGAIKRPAPEPPSSESPEG